MALTRRPVTPRVTLEQREDYEERAAIMEYDAGMTREEAEQWAAYWCFGTPLPQPTFW
jgi:hypothetical protein